MSRCSDPEVAEQLLNKLQLSLPRGCNLVLNDSKQFLNIFNYMEEMCNNLHNYRYPFYIWTSDMPLAWWVVQEDKEFNFDAVYWDEQTRTSREVTGSVEHVEFGVRPLAMFVRKSGCKCWVQVSFRAICANNVQAGVFKTIYH